MADTGYPCVLMRLIACVQGSLRLVVKGSFLDGPHTKGTPCVAVDLLAIVCFIILRDLLDQHFLIL